MKPIWLSLIIVLFVVGCESNRRSPVDPYLALLPAPNNAVRDNRIQDFIGLYNHLHDRPIAAATEKVYAERLYFNDTLVTLTTRRELIAYLEHTLEQLESIDLTVLDVLGKGDDLFVQWKMRTRFVVLGKRSDVQSVGISHLRFDGNGKIVLHQDYWDSTNGFFEHIPIFGGILQWIKNGLY